MSYLAPREILKHVLTRKPRFPSVMTLLAALLMRNLAMLVRTPLTLLQHLMNSDDNSKTLPIPRDGSAQQIMSTTEIHNSSTVFEDYTVNNISKLVSPSCAKLDELSIAEEIEAIESPGPRRRIVNKQ